MVGKERLSRWIFGGVFGAWLGVVYAFVTQAVNWLFLPGVPLAPPSGTLSSYLLQALLLGALLGWICSIPVNRVAGMLMGGGVSALFIFLLALQSAWGGEFFGATLLLMLFTLMPMIVLMLPIAYVIRLGVDAQHVDPDRPYLWARKYLIPAALTLFAVFLGSLALHSKNERAAFQYTLTLIEEGQRSSSVGTLPEPLKDVTGFLENAKGSYSLAYSDRLDTYFGPIPVGPELSQFLIIVRYENGFAFACVFSENRTNPNCAVYFN